MLITLKVLSFNGKQTTQQESSFKKLPIVIGRSPLCDFVLVDQDKFVSSNHAVLTADSEEITIKDTSSNGVFINNSTESLGSGKSTQLADGDQLLIGDYVLSVEISQSNEIHDTSNEAPTNPLSTVLPDWPDPPSKSTDLTEDRISENLLPNDAADNNSAALRPFRNNENVESEDDWDWLPDNRDDDSLSPITESTQYVAPLSDDNSRISETPKANSPVDKDALYEFFVSAGLDPEVFADTDTNLLLQTAGTIMRKTVDGMMLLLNSRSEMKNAIRTDVTRLASVNNNPLKFSPDAKSALTTMLLNQSKQGYLPPDTALVEAFDDLQAHQLAMLDGMKAAVHSMVDKFDPSKLEHRLIEANPIAANIPITREAKLWNLFLENFNQIHDEAMQDFNEIFGLEFRKAYDQRIQNIEHTDE